MKAKYILSVFCGMLLFEAFLSAQTEEFRFKLYMESLSSGKKDTLELGVGPRGYKVDDCRYDSTLCPVYTSPFFDTAEHIGAFLVPGIEDPHHSFQDKFRVKCLLYAKKRIGLLGSDLVIVFPAKEQPVKVSWDMKQLQNPIIETPILTNMDEGCRFDALRRPCVLHLMSEESDCLISYPVSSSPDSYLYTYITDSAGEEHPYIHFYVLPGRDRREVFGGWELATEDFNHQISVSVSPNPIRDRFTISSDMELKEWQIYSVSGRLILSGRDTEREFNCQDWASGLYIFRWNNINHETGFVKIIKE